MSMEFQQQSVQSSSEEVSGGAGGSKPEVEVSEFLVVRVSSASPFSVMQVMMYVLGGPLLGFCAYMLWRHNRDRSYQRDVVGNV